MTEHPIPPALSTRVTRTASRTALYSALGVWGALTVLRNLDRSPALLRKFTRFGLAVPNYRFFAPMPATTDLGMLVRDRDGDGVLSGWNEVVMGQPRSPIHTVWAPFRRPEKAFTDAVRELQSCGFTVIDSDFLPSTVSYKMLLNVARHQVPHDDHTREIQFAICQSAAHESQLAPTMTYVSRFHDLSTGQLVAA